MCKLTIAVERLVGIHAQTMNTISLIQLSIMQFLQQVILVCVYIYIYIHMGRTPPAPPWRSFSARRFCGLLGRPIL